MSERVHPNEMKARVSVDTGCVCCYSCNCKGPCPCAVDCNCVLSAELSERDVKEIETAAELSDLGFEYTEEEINESMANLDAFTEGVEEATGLDLSGFLRVFREFTKMGHAQVEYTTEESSSLPIGATREEMGCGSASTWDFHSLEIFMDDCNVSLSVRVERNHNLSGTENCCLHWSEYRREDYYLGSACCFNCGEEEDLNFDRLTGGPLRLLCEECREKFLKKDALEVNRN